MAFFLIEVVAVRGSSNDPEDSWMVLPFEDLHTIFLV